MSWIFFQVILSSKILLDESVKKNPYLVITSNWNGHVNSLVKSCGNPAHDFVPKDKVILI